MTSSRKSNAACPVSIRLTEEERVALEHAASGQTLSGYIRNQIFTGGDQKRPPRQPGPVQDQKALAQALGLLGAMDLGPSLRTLARAAEDGVLSLSPETEAELMHACAAVIAIRAKILRALGYADGDKP